jgi:hypothetical protein
MEHGDREVSYRQIKVGRGIRCSIRLPLKFYHKKGASSDASFAIRSSELVQSKTWGVFKGLSRC